MAFELCFSGLGFVWLGGRVRGQASHATFSRFGRKSNRSTAPNPREHEFSRERIFHTIRFAICIASKSNSIRPKTTKAQSLGTLKFKKQMMKEH